MLVTYWMDDEITYTMSKESIINVIHLEDGNLFSKICFYCLLLSINDFQENITTKQFNLPYNIVYILWDIYVLYITPFFKTNHHLWITIRTF